MSETRSAGLEANAYPISSRKQSLQLQSRAICAGMVLSRPLPLTLSLSLSPPLSLSLCLWLYDMEPSTTAVEIHLLEESAWPAPRDLKMHGKGVLIGEGAYNAHEKAARPLALLARRNAKHVDAPVGPLVCETAPRVGHMLQRCKTGLALRAEQSRRSRTRVDERENLLHFPELP